ncbi:efflux RND transporter periplasmic adaptor subunit [Rhodocyclus purpureus]|uniref:efflux RND transporter periplasmic adaptor subunit n=1 Tax=Rhodocyclus purpureus TaxID=1067 RepID=UPI00191369FB|nr:efflux RND transporter periplasmic adaptor subunit [Rhodocyclus purpureus]MBK5914591.1 efflux transporter periplasmic adaptor subunit [Rhodocyclus purpureus]
MKLPGLKRRTLALLAVLLPLLLLFIYVALRSGPLAPVAVTVVMVESKPVAPALAGIGTVQARFTYKIGPTFAGRLKHLDVHVGDAVKAGQVLGEIDPVDLDDRIVAQQAALKAAEAVLRQAEARQSFAQTQAGRWEQLRVARVASEELVAMKRQEHAVADAALAAARDDTVRLRAELAALRTQRGNLRLIAPVDGLVASRDADPGTTVVAGQAVVEVIDPASLWVDARFDQISAEGLAAGLPAQLVLRSRHSQPLAGRVLRIEPRADAITEETVAKIVFDAPPSPLPPLGELAEITVQLSPLPAAPTIPNAALRVVDGRRGVWKVVDGDLAFAPVSLGRSDLDGRVQVVEGLAAGERIVVYSEKALGAGSRIRVVERLPGVAP